jgi:alpha-L-rhamnosidase
MPRDPASTGGTAAALRWTQSPLWERWDTEARSRDHAFLGGAIDAWLFEDLAGIEPLEPGWRRFEVAPQPLSDLRWVRASTKTVRGRIAVRWERARERFVLAVDVPVGATAVVRLPGGGAREVGSRSYRFSTDVR